MENYKEEIAKLQNQLDELKSKIEKPQFEVGKWYVLNSDWCFLVNISKIEDNNIFGYGFNYYGTRNEYIENPENAWVDIESLDSYHLATQKEVEEALTKEAVKRGFKEGVKFITAYKNQTLQEYKVIDKFYYEDNIGGLKSCLCSENGYIFCNGTWAEIVKPMSLEELCGNLDKMRLYQIQTYLTENKTQIIETLNNI